MLPIRKIISKQLGELLVERNIITKEQLEKALEIQKGKGGLLGEILNELGYAKEEDIAHALTAQYGFPFLPLANYEIEQQVVLTIPENVCSQYCLIPIDKIGNNLTIAMSNPLNTQAIEDVEEISKCSVQIFVATPSDIRKAIQKYYKNK